MRERVTQRRKGLVESREVRLRIFNDAAEIREYRAGAIDDSTNFRFERNAAQTAPPGHTHTLEVCFEWRSKHGRILIDRQRTAVVRTRNGAEEQRHIRYRARDRAADGQR